MNEGKTLRRLARRLLLIAAAAYLAFLAHVGDAAAHSGPAYPIITDAGDANCMLTVWADPDVGTADFYVLPRGAGCGLPQASVTITVAPVSGRLAEASLQATLRDDRDGATYFAAVPFDRAEDWSVQVAVSSPGTVRLVARARIEVTPDGTIGWIGLLLYSFPFVGVGLLWLKAMRGSAHRQRSVEAHHPRESSS